MKAVIASLVALLLFGGGALLMFYPAPREVLLQLVSQHTYISYGAFVLLLAGATVFAPVTVLPAIPMASVALGPFVTGVLSTVGWTIGAVIAFVIARRVGRPVFLKTRSVQRIDAYIASTSAEARFFTIVLLRITMPVDVLSYALGIVGGVSLPMYTAATALGVVWFSFLFAYLGDALLQGNMLLLTEMVSGAVLLFVGASVILYRRRKRQ